MSGGPTPAGRRCPGRLLNGVVPGIALSAIVIAFGATFGLPSSAGAAGITPCAAAPSGPIVTRDGEATLSRTVAGRKMFRRAGVKTSLVRPANSLTGWPAFPVKKVSFAAVSRVQLNGGLRFSRGKRRVTASNLVVVVPRNKRRAVTVTAKLSGRKLVLLKLAGGTRKIRDKRGELDLLGFRGSLGAAAAKRLNQRLGIARRPASKRLRPGVKADRFDLNATYFVSSPKDPVAETPIEPAVKAEPAGALPISAAPGQVAIRWELRDSWINYVNTGETPKPADGATAGDPRPPKNLVYDFSFPFTSGWTTTDPDASSGGETQIYGSGSLAFRFCEHFVNFKVANPEIELGGADDSRMIFRVDGADSTAFPNLRAVMVKLVPDPATQRQVSTTGEVTTVTWTRIPGYIPAEGTGIFAGFYPAWDPANGAPGSGYTEATRPDRFGFLSLTYTVPAEETP